MYVRIFEHRGEEIVYLKYEKSLYEMETEIQNVYNLRWNKL